MKPHTNIKAPSSNYATSEEHILRRELGRSFLLHLANAAHKLATAPDECFDLNDGEKLGRKLAAEMAPFVQTEINREAKELGENTESALSSYQGIERSFSWEYMTNIMYYAFDAMTSEGDDDIASLMFHAAMFNKHDWCEHCEERRPCECSRDQSDVKRSISQGL